MAFESSPHNTSFFLNRDVIDITFYATSKLRIAFTLLSGYKKIKQRICNRDYIYIASSKYLLPALSREQGTLSKSPEITADYRIQLFNIPDDVSYMSCLL